MLRYDLGFDLRNIMDVKRIKNTKDDGQYWKKQVALAINGCSWSLELYVRLQIRTASSTVSGGI